MGEESEGHGIMKQGFKQLFIGFLFVFVNIHIIVDIMPNFIGYIFIYNGIKLIATLTSQNYGKLKLLCIILTIASIPSFFLNDSLLTQSDWLSYYPVVLTLLKVILVFYLFDLMKQATLMLPTKESLIYTERVFAWYMIIVILHLFIQSFTLNITNDFFIFLSIASVIFMIGAEIALLIYLNKIKKSFPEEGAFERFV